MKICPSDTRCEACLLHSHSKPDPPYNGLPRDLTLMAPNEVISLDFMDVIKKPVLVVKDQHTRFIWARLTPMTRYFHTFDRPSVVLSDGGPWFGPELSKFLEAYHI